MTFLVITVISFLTPLVVGQSTSPSPSAPWSDPFADGKPSNPGARFLLTKKSLDAVHEYAAESIIRSLQALTLGDFVLFVGTGTLTIKPPRINEATLGRYDYDMVPSNRIRSRFFDGRLSAGGVWQFKPTFGSAFGSTYQATVTNAELNATNELGRTTEGKPQVRTTECKSYLGEHRIDIKNVAAEFSVIENCQMDMCMKIREFFEKAFCDVFTSFVKDMINGELQQYPTRVSIYGDQQKVDYSLKSNSPTVIQKNSSIQGDLEGKYIWRGSNWVPFNPAEMASGDHDRMVGFQLSDFTFNTLLQQAHSSGHKHSAFDLASPSIQQVLSLNCDPQAKPSPAPAKSKYPSGPQRKKSKTSVVAGAGAVVKPGKTDVSITGGVGVSAKDDYQCLGAFFHNLTNYGPFSANDTGDIVFKSGQKSMAVFLESEKNGWFDGCGGVLEIYGPAVNVGSRQLLARADVRLLRGEFKPVLNKVNITGTIVITSLKLAQASPETRAFTEDSFEKLAKFVTPILNDVLNNFFNLYAQFPLPLPRKYVCTSPKFTVRPRTMQVDCDVQRVVSRSGDCKQVCSHAGGTFCCDKE